MIGREKGKEPLECDEDLLEVTDPWMFWEVDDVYEGFCDCCGQFLLSDELCEC